MQVFMSLLALSLIGLSRVPGFVPVMSQVADKVIAQVWELGFCKGL